jgi:hypothetical protein
MKAARTLLAQSFPHGTRLSLDPGNPCIARAQGLL